MDDHKTFLQRLAMEINRGPDKFSFDSLKTYFLGAVEAIPYGQMKDILQQQNEENADYLWSLLKPGKKISKIQFSLFNKDGVDEMLKRISQFLSYKEQVDCLTEVALCCPCKKVLELQLIAEKKANPDQSQLEVLKRVTELNTRLAVTCHNFEVLTGLMQVFSSEVDDILDKYKTMKVTQQSWINFKDVICNFLWSCHIMKSTIQQENGDMSVEEGMEYRDLLAAVTAIYIDVIIAIGRVQEDVHDHLCTSVWLLLGDSPRHILDVANQIFNLNSNTVEIIFPFLQKVFSLTRTCTTECSKYIRYVVLASKVLNCVCNLEVESLYMKKEVCPLFPPQHFVSWLRERDTSFVEDFGLSGLTEQQITDTILQCNDERNIERLLDLASSSGRSKVTTRTEQDDDDGGAEMEQDESNMPLFFVDAQGSSELLEKCEEEEITSTHNYKMLKAQIDIMLERRAETGSEDEKEDFDINLDDNELETTINIDDGDAERKDGENGEKERESKDEVPVKQTTLDNLSEALEDDENQSTTIATAKENESLRENEEKRRLKRKSKTSTATHKKKRGCK